MSNQEHTEDPVVDAIVLMNEIEQLKQRIKEQEFQISAMGDVHRLNLMTHLLPHYLNSTTDSDRAIELAVQVADDCVSKLEVDMNAKAAQLLKSLESVEDAIDKDDDEMTEN